MLKFLLHICLIFVISNHDAAAQSRTNFIIKRFDVCETKGPVYFSGNVTKDGSNQYLDFNLTSRIPLDSNIGMITSIDTLVFKRNFQPLFTIREKNFCEALNKYVGELWYDVERAAQVPVGVCPIAAGRYLVHHLLLDFRKVTLQTFPFGTIRLTFHAIDKRNSNIVFCVVTEIYNMPN